MEVTPLEISQMVPRRIQLKQVLLTYVITSPIILVLLGVFIITGGGWYLTGMLLIYFAAVYMRMMRLRVDYKYTINNNGFTIDFYRNNKYEKTELSITLDQLQNLKKDTYDYKNKNTSAKDFTTGFSEQIYSFENMKDKGLVLIEPNEEILAAFISLSV